MVLVMESSRRKKRQQIHGLRCKIIIEKQVWWLERAVLEENSFCKGSILKKIGNNLR
jgi:hypothetical protein